MTGLLIFGGTILFVVLAIGRYERRFSRAPQPWTDAVVDRDSQRMNDEVRSLVSPQAFESQRITAPHFRRHSAA